MRKAELHQKDYDALKSHIIADMWFHIKDRPEKSIDLMETKGIPAIVTNFIDDQESEIVDEIVVEGSDVLIKASIYGEPTTTYKAEEFEVPFLILILDSIEKHLELEDKVIDQFL